MTPTSSTRKYPMEISVFSTESDRHWQDPDQNDILTAQPFVPPYRYIPPRIIMGLSQIDLGPKIDNNTGTITGLTIGVKSSAEAIDMAAFEPRVSIWGDGRMSATTCTWLHTAGDNPNIQSGTFKTTRGSETTSKIKFKTAFKTTPTVLVFLSGFQLGSTGEWDIGGDAENIEETGFKLVVTVGEYAVLHQSVFSWVAFESSDQICGGRVDGINIGATDENVGEYRHWDGDHKVEFTSKFVKEPQVAQWISRIKTNKEGMRVRFPWETCVEKRQKKIENDGMIYNVETWYHCKIEEAEMSWVAVASA